MGSEDRIDRAGRLYDRAVFGGDPSGLDPAEQGLDTVEADLSLARGRILHARFLHDGTRDPRELPLFEHAAGLYRRLGDTRGGAWALFWIGCYHQLLGDDDTLAVPALERSLALAERAGDPLTASYALRHLGIAEHRAGRLDGARAHLEESTRLRRALGFTPGVAANLVGLAYLAAAQDRPDDAQALIEEAGTLADAADAQGIVRQVDEARAHL
ncbi:tetratricopeptide repeat protein [Longispora sp. NPDC051575]|uniref:tetratricopeptide repeat protein n=1 Tax=Longispora sp. NPDC051575 TaxID=3154943 RepID=UPI00342B3B8E